MKRNIITLVAVVLLGAGYGCLSAFQNQNPYDPSVGKSAWQWQPSPVWLPSFILCKAPGNVGIRHTKSGYLFRSQADLIVYFSASTILGGIIGGLAGCVVLLVMRRKTAKLVRE